MRREARSSLAHPRPYCASELGSGGHSALGLYDVGPVTVVDGRHAALKVLGNRGGVRAEGVAAEGVEVSWARGYDRRGRLLGVGEELLCVDKLLGGLLERIL